jgi:hypothetical protein
MGMAKKPRAPRTPGNCPGGGNHTPVKVSETATHVTHKCTKCPYTETRPKRNRMTLGDVLCLLAGCALLGFVAVLLFEAARFTP